MIWCSHLSPQDPGSVIFCVWLLFTAAGQYKMQTYKSEIWTIFEVEWNPSYLSLSSSFWEDCWRNLNITLWVLSVTVGRNVHIYSFSRHFWCLILTPCPDIWATNTTGFSILYGGLEMSVLKVSVCIYYIFEIKCICIYFIIKTIMPGILQLKNNYFQFECF